MSLENRLKRKSNIAGGILPYRSGFLYANFDVFVKKKIRLSAVLYTIFPAWTLVNKSRCVKVRGFAANPGASRRRSVERRFLRDQRDQPALRVVAGAARQVQDARVAARPLRVTGREDL